MSELDDQIELCKNIDRDPGDDIDCGELAGKVKAGDMSIDEMKSIIKDYTVEPEEPQNLTLYTAEGCPSCKKAREILKPDIESGAVDVVDISNDGEMGEYLTEKFGGVPALAVEHDGKMCEVDMITGEVGDCAEPFSE